ncbi:MAG: hypothetical protein E6R03_03200 [Hyphomicrobiaceae bacterium]|nr:MAG: hypothetical protein E6R03_03200 [Hyphomicrobiaceae bacterium]
MTEIKFFKRDETNPNKRRGGGGFKTPERIAFETCPPGKSFFVEKSKTTFGSIRAWKHIVGTERGVRFSTRVTPDGWIITAYTAEEWEKRKQAWQGN